MAFVSCSSRILLSDAYEYSFSALVTATGLCSERRSSISSTVTGLYSISPEGDMPIELEDIIVSLCHQWFFVDFIVTAGATNGVPDCLLCASISVARLWAWPRVA